MLFCTKRQTLKWCMSTSILTLHSESIMRLYGRHTFTKKGVEWSYLLDLCTIVYVYVYTYMLIRMRLWWVDVLQRCCLNVSSILKLWNNGSCYWNIDWILFALSNYPCATFLIIITSPTTLLNYIYTKLYQH